MIKSINLIRASVAVAAFVVAGHAKEAVAHPRGHTDTEHAEPADVQAQDTQAVELRRLKTLLQENPRNQKNAVAYARQAAKRARRLGDTALLRDAAHALSPWDNDAEAQVDILIVRANIKQINHQFDAALADLDVVLKRQPANPQALLSRAFILATTGNAKRGQMDCAALQPNISIVIKETCVARLGSLTGKLETAHRRMQAVLAIAPATRAEERAFALGVAAEIADRRGDADNARKLYAELLAMDSQSVYAQAAYADFLISQGENKTAAQIIGDSPHTEALLMLSALSGKEIDSAVSRRAANTLHAQIAVDQTNRDYAHAREYARFALDYMKEPDLALVFAKENWRTQKESVDARILARAALAKNDAVTLDQLRTWVDGTSLEDPALMAILQEQGNRRTAAQMPLDRLTQP